MPNGDGKGTKRPNGDGKGTNLPNRDGTRFIFFGFGVKETLIGCGRLVNVFFKLFIGFWHVCCLQKFV